MIITRVKALEDLGDFSNSHIVKKWLDITDDSHGANASIYQCDTSSDKISSSKNRRRSTKASNRSVVKLPNC